MSQEIANCFDMPMSFSISIDTAALRKDLEDAKKGLGECRRCHAQHGATGKFFEIHKGAFGILCDDCHTKFLTWLEGKA